MDFLLPCACGKMSYFDFPISSNRLMCKGYGVVFCFAKSPLPAAPSLTHQPVSALWQLWRLSLKRLNRLFTTEIKKRSSLMTGLTNTIHNFLFLLCMQFYFSPFLLHYALNTHPKGVLQFTSQSKISGFFTMARPMEVRCCCPPES